MKTASAGARWGALSILLLLFATAVVAEDSGDVTTAQQTTAKVQAKSVAISLSAKWKETPLYLETSEFLAEETNNFFWAYIDLLYVKLGADTVTAMSPVNQYELAVALASDILGSPAKVSLLKFALALRIHSPVVAMFNQIAADKLKQYGGECAGSPAFVELSRPSISQSSPLHCNLEKVQAAIDAFSGLEEPLIHPQIYSVDHIYSGPQLHSAATVVLYGEIGSQAFLDLHNVLKIAAKNGKIKYLVRHCTNQREGRNEVSLSGYGVELAIKSTEYRAIDDRRVKGEASSITETLQETESEKPDEIEGFRISALKQLYPDKIGKLDEFSQHLMDSNKEIATLKVWELQELSLQTARKVLSSPVEDQLRVLRDIVQNFPVHAKSLIHVSVPSEMKREIEKNQQYFMQNLNLGTGDTALFINGMFFDLDTTDIFTLLNHLKSEMRLVDGLNRVLSNNQESVSKMLRLDVSSDKQDYQVDIRDSAVVYINDIENDKMYKSWPSSLQDLLRPTYPGMLRNVRKNMYNLVLVVDPSKRETHDIIKLAESFYVHKAPLRIGFVFVVQNASKTGYEDASVACLNAFNFISQEKTAYDGLSFLTDVMAAAEGERDVTSDDVVENLKLKYPQEDLELIFGADSDYDTGAKLSLEFLSKTGLGTSTKTLLNGVLLKDANLNADMFEEAVLTEIMRQTPVMQKAVYSKELSDTNDILDWLMSQKSVMPRLNKRILGTDSTETNRFLDLNGDAVDELTSLNELLNLRPTDILSTLHKQLRYITSDESGCYPITVWIAGNLQTPEGRSVLASAIRYIRESSNKLRLAVVHTAGGPITALYETALKAIPDQSALNYFLAKLLDEENIARIENDINISAELVSEPFRDAFKSLLGSASKFPEVHEATSLKCLDINSPMAVIINGRVVEIPVGEQFNEDDFSLIEKYVMSSYGDKVLAELDSDTKSDASKCSDVVMRLGSVLLAERNGKQRHDIKFHGDKHSLITLPPTEADAPAIDVVGIAEPLSRGAQKLAPILITLQKVVNMKIRVFMNCVDKHSDLPLKSFFRYVLDSEPNFPENEPDAVPSWRAHFASMPVSPLFTLAMVTPENWLVEGVRSPYDLDNIHLEEVDGNGVWGDFELAQLLLEGHCFEQSTGNPPRGLQFVLGTNSTPVTGDTIVMANLGYFQLKANPGAWTLKLRPGRSAEIYTIVSHEGTEVSHSGSSPEISVLISNFRSNVVKVKVSKKPGKQNEDLLRDSEDQDVDNNSIWGSLSSWTGSKSDQNGTQESEDKLNIFSLASGHLYERLLRIMMLSVLKHTKTPVKFWFLKNYLSPTFKEFLPEMSKTYGFEYELVEYKWPRWLHQQTEKQRIIWGYKILFLDVLFPLDVKKIIFVDADQVVRADLKELRDLDLEGAPYGYTPFCESRTEMDGFRFWKSGYWASHLHGRKYHISALYVVDLQRFRRIAAGDRLRGQYQGLSQDPNSLSNLDQDLPNNMIHQVSIKSLPQEWLWCETWCSDESKTTAKTIDLCNNPKTKEPKLTGARRILPEWEGYDNEIKKVMDVFMDKKRNDERLLSPSLPATAGSSQPSSSSELSGSEERQEQAPYVQPLPTPDYDKTEL